MTLKFYFLNPKNRILLRHMVTTEQNLPESLHINNHVDLIRLEFLSWTAQTNTLMTVITRRLFPVLWLVNIASAKHQRC